MRILIVHIVTLLFWVGAINAQPLLNSMQEVEGLTIYQDLEKSDLFYYAPNRLKLATETNGKPKFKLIQLRYTGTAMTAEQGQNRFINLVQLTVNMDAVSNRQLQKARTAFTEKIKLRPLPLKNVEGFLVTAVGEEYKRLGEGSGFESLSNGTQGSLWTERAFTLRMNNFDAQILWEQVHNGKLALSINYAFYADFIIGSSTDYQLQGDSSTIADLKSSIDELTNIDSTMSTEIVASNSFPITIDVKQFPEAIQQIDVNESQSVAYPLLEVRCYDFTYDLRPDLGVKSIEIEGTSVTGQLIRLKKHAFFKNRPDQFVQQVKFDFAININIPFRYRTIEWTLQGEEVISDWITRQSWIGLLDITTREEDNPIDRKVIDLETDLDRLFENNFTGLEVLFRYMYKERERFHACRFDKEESSPFKTIAFIFDKNTPVEYKVIWKSASNRKVENFQSIGLDNYIFLNVPES